MLQRMAFNFHRAEGSPIIRSSDCFRDMKRGGWSDGEFSVRVLDDMSITSQHAKEMRGSSDDLRQYLIFLRDQVARYLSILDTMFGARDPRFVFRTIGLSSDGRPRTHFPECFHLQGGCSVDILITSHPWEHFSHDQGPWQVAHECVHLMDPGREGTTNTLEEGLATWFQNEPTYHSESVRRYIANDPTRLSKYVEAEKLVRSDLRHILTAVKRLRLSGVRIREINAEMLAPLLPNLETRTVERLCAAF